MSRWAIKPKSKAVQNFPHSNPSPDSSHTARVVAAIFQRFRTVWQILAAHVFKTTKLIEIVLTFFHDYQLWFCVILKPHWLHPAAASPQLIISYGLVFSSSCKFPTVVPSEMLLGNRNEEGLKGWENRSTTNTKQNMQRCWNMLKVYDDMVFIANYLSLSSARKRSHGGAFHPRITFYLRRVCPSVEHNDNEHYGLQMYC